MRIYTSIFASIALLGATIVGVNAQTVTGTVTGTHSGPLCIKFRVQTMSGPTAFQYSIPNGTAFDGLRADWETTVVKGLSRQFVGNPAPGPSACMNNDGDVFEIYQIN